jgi:ABC-type nitrate/sulfonate/bicarbonate transport system substrate-binding protein
MLLSVYAFRGKELGFRELLDLGSLDVPFPQAVTLTTRDFLRDKKDLARRFMAAYLDGLELFLKNPQVGKKALARFTGVKDEKVLDADYLQYTGKYLNKNVATEPRTLSIVFDRIGVTSGDERDKLFKGVVDNSILVEAKALRSGSSR